MFSADGPGCWPPWEAMMTPEQKLELVLADGAEAGRDVAFSAAVMERVARRRAWLTAAAAAPWALIAAVVLWALYPVVRLPAEQVVAGLSGAGMILALTATALIAARLAVRELGRR